MAPGQGNGPAPDEGIPALCDSFEAGGPASGQGREKELAILFYMNGEYGDIIGSTITHSLLKIEEQGSDENVSILAQIGYKPAPGEGIDAPPRYDVRRYEIGPPVDHPANGNVKEEEVPGIVKSRLIERLEDNASITQAGVLEDFIAHGMSSYPARHYMVVFMGHGSGWKGALKIDPAEMGKAVQKGVERSNHATGRQDGIDVQVFNTCLMGSVEALSEMKDTSRYTLASEDVAQAYINNDWEEHLPAIKNKIKEEGQFNPGQFAGDFVETYRDRQVAGKNLAHEMQGLSDDEKKKRVAEQVEKIHTYRTLTAIDNSKVAPLEKSIKNFVEALKAENVDDSKVFGEIAKSRDFMAFDEDQGGKYHYSAHLKDLGGIMDNVSKAEWSSPPLKKAAKEVLDRMKEAIIGEQHEGLEPDGYSGLSVWAPVNAGVIHSFKDEYAQKVPGFSGETGWGDFLEGSAGKVPVELREDFAKMKGTGLVKFLEEFKVQEYNLKRKPFDIEREKGDILRKQELLENTDSPRLRERFQKEIAQKEAVIKRWEGELAKARETYPSLAVEKEEKLKRLGELDPLLDLSRPAQEPSPGGETEGRSRARE
jgi:hypothetical protein